MLGGQLAAARAAHAEDLSHFKQARKRAKTWRAGARATRELTQRHVPQMEEALRVACEQHALLASTHAKAKAGHDEQQPRAGGSPPPQPRDEQRDARASPPALPGRSPVDAIRQRAPRPACVGAPPACRLSEPVSLPPSVADSPSRTRI